MQIIMLGCVDLFMCILFLWDLTQAWSNFSKLDQVGFRHEKISTYMYFFKNILVEESMMSSSKKHIHAKST